MAAPLLFDGIQQDLDALHTFMNRGYGPQHYQNQNAPPPAAATVELDMFNLIHHTISNSQNIAIRLVIGTNYVKK